jgi:uncharacterized phage protein (TIGR01671 family)
MREIKFRAWHESNKVMVNFDNAVLCRDVYQREFLAHLLNGDFGDVLMQFTGLKDENGIDIYEGDIFGGFELEVLSWDNQYQRYCIKINNRRAGWLTEFKSKHRKVIGNIHQNPELLEVNNG